MKRPYRISELNRGLGNARVALFNTKLKKECDTLSYGGVCHLMGAYAILWGRMPSYGGVCHTPLHKNHVEITN